MSNKTIDRQTRKSTVWTRDKISHLIHLYRQHECLWNHYVDEYRSKDHRTKAVDIICNTLRISKFDFGKKIHNLRNQFNSEMKKLERRIEEAGGNPEDADVIKTHRCRWEHFESLLFLRKVIEPRPGFQTSYHTPKKMRLKYEESFKNEKTSSETKEVSLLGGEELQEYHLEETTEGVSEQLEGNSEDFHEYEAVEEDATNIERENNMDHKYNPTITRTSLYKNTKRDAPTSAVTSKTYYTCISKPSSINQTTHHTQPELVHIEENQPLATNSVIELTNNSRDHGSVTTVLPARDQWDIFGELIANEFRLLNSDMSRKRLKRKIMQDLLSIGEEDDNNYSKQLNSV